MGGHSARPRRGGEGASDRGLASSEKDKPPRGPMSLSLRAERPHGRLTALPPRLPRRIASIARAIASSRPDPNDRDFQPARPYPARFPGPASTGPAGPSIAPAGGAARERSM